MIHRPCSLEDRIVKRQASRVEPRGWRRHQSIPVVRNESRRCPADQERNTRSSPRCIAGAPARGYGAHLGSTAENPRTAITGVTASRSNLTGADLVGQVIAMTESQMLSQAAATVFAQADSAPQAVSKLLG